MGGVIHHIFGKQAEEAQIAQRGRL